MTFVDVRPSDAVFVARRCGGDVMAEESGVQAAQRGRLRPDATEAERRPLDRAEALIREAGRQLLESMDQHPPVLEKPEPSPAAPNAEITPEQALIVAGVSGTLGDDNDLTELLRRLKPASRRVM